MGDDKPMEYNTLSGYTWKEEWLPFLLCADEAGSNQSQTLARPRNNIKAVITGAYEIHAATQATPTEKNKISIFAYSNFAGESGCPILCLQGKDGSEMELKAIKATVEKEIGKFKFLGTEFGVDDFGFMFTSGGSFCKENMVEVFQNIRNVYTKAGYGTQTIYLFCDWLKARCLNIHSGSGSSKKTHGCLPSYLVQREGYLP